MVHANAETDGPQNGQLGSEITEGTKLFFVSNNLHFNRRRTEYWTVSKVGRKWISFDCGYRADKTTFEVDGAGYSSPGRLWQSEEEYRAETRRCDLWNRLRAHMERTRYKPPKDITEFKIRQMAAIAGFSLDEVV